MSTQYQGVSIASGGSGASGTKDIAMKSDAKNTPPVRPSATKGQQPAAAVATSSGRGANGTKDDGAVPHVVRVTFLGVSGILATPPHRGATTPGPIETVAGTSPAAEGHPSLLLPLPPHMRMVASVSRSRTARGIPSEVSKCLSRSGISRQGGGGGSLKPVLEELNISIDQSVVLSIDKSPTGGLLRERTSNSRSHSPIPEIEVRQLAPSTSNDKRDTEKALTEEDQTERFVAIWDHGGKRTNALAFEAELRPTTVLDAKAEGGGQAPMASASTAFAPKTYFVTLGLVPDYDASCPDGSDDSAALSPPNSRIGASVPPKFAIPVAFTDLVIDGSETLDGRRRQIDLPLSSISNFMNSFGVNASERGNYFPLVQLTAEGFESKVDTKVVASAAASALEKNTAPKKEKTKRKSIVKRIFSRKQHEPIFPTVWESSTVQTPIVYSGTPRSIFELDRPPNAKERNLFLDRYNVDSGGAMLRIGIEVFPRGSELEKIFRQKKLLRKKQAQASPIKAKTKLKKNESDDRSLYSQISQSTSGSRAHSLMDADDSDYDDDESIYSESYFTLDDNKYNSSWEDSTMYTEGFTRASSFNTNLSMDTYMTEDENMILASPRSDNANNAVAGGFLSNFLTCNLDTSCVGSKGGEIRGMYANEDPVASRIDEEILGKDSLDDTAALSFGSMSILNEEFITELREKHAQDNIVLSSSNAKLIPESIRNTEKQRSADRSTVTILGKSFEGMENTGGSDGAIHPSLDVIASLDVQSVNTEGTETTPLAVILQRVLQDPNKDTNRVPDQVGEGHELTLEDHFTV
jgi:hypothetical protein